MPAPRAALFLSASLALLFPAFPAGGQTEVEISWGTSLFEQKLITSNGTSLDPGNLIIEFGSFDNSFIPNHSNMAQWLSEWRVFDAIRDTDPGPATTDSDPNDSFTNTTGTLESARFAGQGHLLADGTSDSEDASPSHIWSPGEQGFYFIRTSDSFDPSSEWLLVTSLNASQGDGDSIWEFPALVGGQPQFSLAWWLEDADRAVFGAIHGGTGNGGDTGLGSYTDSSTNFTLRLHAIPEPTPLGLAFLGLTLLAPVRRRLPAP